MTRAILTARITTRKLCTKKSVFVVCTLLFALGGLVGLASAQKDRPVGRLLMGKVLDQHDNPLPNAVVYLTNTRTRAVKTYIIGPEGTYRFPGLTSSVDYEVYAQYEGRKSDAKSVSQFDDRSQVYIDLKINMR